MKAIELLSWNEDLPNVRVVDLTPEGYATPVFGVVADYGWAERILCEGCYQQDAEAIKLAIEETIQRG